MNKTTIMIAIGLLSWGFFLSSPPMLLKAAPPIQTDSDAHEESEDEAKKEEQTEDEKKENAKKKKRGATLSKLRKYLEGEEKKLRVRGHVFSSKLNVTDCTSADKARSRLNDVGDEGGIVVKEDLNIAAHNEAHIEKNEGSINNVTEVTITNEIYKRC